jgi:asparagine synthase (glutamine-hydrolysing)
MCGIAGFLDARARSDQASLESLARRMADAQRHRGPDDAGTWADAAAGIAFGHRRLSIIDLSPEGHQPQLSADGRYVVCFNGEIYNYRSLRADLEQRGHRFRGHSDTSILLACIVEYGVAEALRRFNGMFAFALWDRRDRRLYLARDRLGEKPLYYGRLDDGTFAFASELKAIAAHPSFGGTIDRDALGLYLRHAYVPSPRCIYRGLAQLRPGTFVSVDATSVAKGIDPRPTAYWSVREAAERGLADRFRGSTEEATEALDMLLRDAVKLRMEADVPLGAFLSGGIDSSTVVALMQAQSSRPVRTFSIGFHDAGFNEADHAKAVAQHLGTDHTELYLRPDDALAVIPRLPFIYDEPFADSSQIPTLLVSELARRHVTVSLSGDGGDELFGGYPRYPITRMLWDGIRWMPAPLRRRVAARSLATPRPVLGAAFGGMTPALRRLGARGEIGEKLHPAAGLMQLPTGEALYDRLIARWPDGTVLGADLPLLTPATDAAGWPAVDHLVEWMMYVDSVMYLPDDILVKVDRASMSVSLEARVPLLDHRVVELAWRLPLALRLRLGSGKRLLRRVLHRYVPRAMVERPKMGFGVPIGSWLRGPLRDWAESLLDGRRLRDEGLLDAALVRERWDDHVHARRTWDHDLWTVLMLEAWLDAQRRPASALAAAPARA